MFGENRFSGPDWYRDTEHIKEISKKAAEVLRGVAGSEVAAWAELADDAIFAKSNSEFAKLVKEMLEGIVADSQDGKDKEDTKEMFTDQVESRYHDLLLFARKEGLLKGGEKSDFWKAFDNRLGNKDEGDRSARTAIDRMVEIAISNRINDSGHEYPSAPDAKSDIDVLFGIRSEYGSPVTDDERAAVENRLMEWRLERYSDSLG